MQIENLSLFETTGFSMWPFIKPKEKLIIKRTPLEDLRVGDIILYLENGQLACHRLVKKIKDIEKYLLYVRGDKSTSLPNSELVTEQMFLGKAIGIIRNSKTVNLVGWRQQFINWLIVIIAPLVSRGVIVIKPLVRCFRRFCLPR